MKQVIAVISFIAILIGGWMLAPTVAVMQSEVACEQDVIVQANGRYTRDELAGHFVMHKEPGFGAKYGELRNGEWEYVAYKADGNTVVAQLAQDAEQNSCFVWRERCRRFIE